MTGGPPAGNGGTTAKGPAAWEGIFVALTTPFEHGAPAPARAAANIAKYNLTALAGYLVLGSTGECVLLSDRESLTILGTVASAAAPGKAVMAGTARESTAATIEFTNACAGEGARAALVRAPSYYKGRMTREVLRRHFLEVADKSRIPVLLYNIPQNTGLRLEPELIVELAGHPNIAGLKESGGDLAMVPEIMRQVPKDFRYFLGAAGVLLPGLAQGACGGILAVANVVPGTACRVFDLFRRGDMRGAEAEQMELSRWNRALNEKHGIPGLKYTQDLLGYYGGLPRPPLLPLGEEARAEIGAMLTDGRKNGL